MHTLMHAPFGLVGTLCHLHPPSKVSTVEQKNYILKSPACQIEKREKSKDAQGNRRIIMSAAAPTRLLGIRLLQITGSALA